MERLASDPAHILPKRFNLAKLSFFLDRRMLKILNLVDGEKNLVEIAFLSGESMLTTAGTMKKLLDAGLVELVITDTKEDERESFFFLLRQYLPLAIGPIADLFLEDEIERMGESWNTFPKERMPELVNSLAGQIPRENARASFRESMFLVLQRIMSANF